MSCLTFESKCKGIWHRALKESSLDQLAAKKIARWAENKGIINPVVIERDVGAFHSTPCVVLEADGKKACFPKISSAGDADWLRRREIKDSEAQLWRKVEWFQPLWIPNGKIDELLSAVNDCSAQRAIELFDHHTSTLYTLAFEAVCIAQVMAQARSFKEIVPLAREAYLGIYSGYRASSIAALIPAVEGALTRIVSDLPPGAAAPDKIDHAINRAIHTAASLHFERMWVPAEYSTVDYLFGQDERVFAFETFRNWLKEFFFCNTKDYRGITWLNRHMFAHGTASSWQRPTNFTRLVVALATLAAVESWYDESHRVSFFLPAMNDDGKLLWQQAILRGETQMKMSLLEQSEYQKQGRLVPEMPTDDGVLLRTAILSDECMRDLVRPLRDAGWSVSVSEPDDAALYVIVSASCGDKSFNVALLYSCATGNNIYQNLSKICEFILYRGAPYKQSSYAYQISVHVGPVLAWQPPRTAVQQGLLSKVIAQISAVMKNRLAGSAKVRTENEGGRK